MAGRVLGYLTEAGSSGGRNSYGGVGIGSTVSRPSDRRVLNLVNRCYRCTLHSTCYTVGLSARACD